MVQAVSDHDDDFIPHNIEPLPGLPPAPPWVSPIPQPQPPPPPPPPPTSTPTPSQWTSVSMGLTSFATTLHWLLQQPYHAPDIAESMCLGMTLIGGAGIIHWLVQSYLDRYHPTPRV